MTDPTASPVLHVIVVGFHHKKGCQVEYSHPPLMPDGDPHGPDLPSQWRQLPSLALPDGSHNHDADTAYFHLPALDNPRKTVFGISCFRQIDSDRVVNKTADITRGSVQKSVCVLSRLPLYGHIQVKMSLITEAYFREGDFSRLDLIHQTYDNLNSCLSDEMVRTQQLYVGLSARAFVTQCRQRALVLFKLLLLERKVLFMQSPVEQLCGFFLTLLSLHPGMLEDGLDEAARMVPADTPPSLSPQPPKTPPTDREENKEDKEETESVISNSSVTQAGIKGKLSGAFGYITGYKSNDQLSQECAKSVTSLDADAAADNMYAEGAEEAGVPVPNFQQVASMSTEELGLPLKVFTGGNLCHPYLSLSYLDILSQPSVHGYLIGATNILFKQKKGMADVVIELDKDKMDVVSDPELRKALHLTTEDLRFIDNVVKHVSEESRDVFMDGVGWEGGDEWVRAQFRFYLTCLLRTGLMDDEEAAASQHTGHFNHSFMTAWKRTQNYRAWKDSPAAIMLREELPVGHPFAGHLSVTDMRLHLSNTISNTESGKKVSAAVANTGKAVAGGLSSAKGAFSSFLGSFRNKEEEEEEVKEVKEAVEEKEAEKVKTEENK